MCRKCGRATYIKRKGNVLAAYCKGCDRLASLCPCKPVGDSPEVA